MIAVPFGAQSETIIEFKIERTPVIMLSSTQLTPIKSTQSGKIEPHIYLKSSAIICEWMDGWLRPYYTIACNNTVQMVDSKFICLKNGLSAAVIDSCSRDSRSMREKTMWSFWLFLII